MQKFKNVSPLGDLDVTALGRVVKAGETFSVRADLARYFEAQPSNFEPVTKPADHDTAGDEPPAVDQDKTDPPAETGENKEADQ